MTTLTRTKADGGAWITTVDAGGGGGDLPSWWDVDNTPGSESVEFGGSVVIAPSDPDAILQTIKMPTGFYEGASYAVMETVMVGGDPTDNNDLAHVFWADGGITLRSASGQGGAYLHAHADPDGFVTAPSTYHISPGDSDDGPNLLLIANDPAPTPWIQFEHGGQLPLGIMSPTPGDLFDIRPTGAVTISPTSGDALSAKYPNGDPALNVGGSAFGVLVQLRDGDTFDVIQNSAGTVFRIADTGPVSITPSDDSRPLFIQGGIGSTVAEQSMIEIEDENANLRTLFSAIGDFAQQLGTAGTMTIDSAGGGKLQINNTGLGFFGTTAVPKPTGVAATGPGVHAALVTLGLIAA